MNQKTRNLIKKTWLFKWYIKYNEFKGRNHQKEMNTYFKEEGPELLKHFANALNDDNILFWLDFGTLLGFCREHDFIPHDDDLDVGANIADEPRIKASLTKAGFELVRHFHTEKDGNIEECYRYKHTLIDVFYFQPEQDHLYCYIYFPYINSLVPRHYKVNEKRPYKVWKVSVEKGGYEKAEFKGAEVWVPKNVEKYLTAHYGPQFMTPDPYFSRLDVASNITVMDYNDNPAYAYFLI